MSRASRISRVSGVSDMRRARRVICASVVAHGTGMAEKVRDTAE